MNTDTHAKPYQTMTLREHYVGLAMQGLIGSKEYNSFRDVVMDAVICADLLIKELEKDKK